MPTPILAAPPGSAMPLAPARFDEETRAASALECRAPSPVFFSQPHAPRWLRLTRTVSALRMIALDLRPLMSATKPTPHASCSYRGS